MSFMEIWDFTREGKFVVQETLEIDSNWAASPESTVRVNITCPKCSTLYRLQHKSGCGLDLQIQAVLNLGQCAYSDCNIPISEDIADCPSCGLECRDMAHVILQSNGCWSFRAVRRLIRVKPE